MQSQKRENIIRLISLSRRRLNAAYKKLVSCLLIFTFTITNITYGYEGSNLSHLRDIVAQDNRADTGGIHRTFGITDDGNPATPSLHPASPAGAPAALLAYMHQEGIFMNSRRTPTQMAG